eukprot:485598-Prymnesium_polylepis.1
MGRLSSSKIGLKLNGGRVGTIEADVHVLNLLRHAGYRTGVLSEGDCGGRRHIRGSRKRVGTALLAARGGTDVVTDALAAKGLHEGVLAR